ncbi:MAG: hypothetical protein K1X79_07120 [Oligoflexia bacterium]|nr:hypothetical protein [Oligoflexia bacterium]
MALSPERFIRLEAEFSRATPFAVPPQDLAEVEAHQDIAQLRKVLTQLSSNLSLVELAPCGFRHEIRQNGDYGSICSDLDRHTRITCAHGAMWPVRAALTDLRRLDFITNEEVALLTSKDLHAALERGDYLAGVIYSYLECKNTEPTSALADSAKRLGLSVPLSEITDDNAHSTLKLEQVRAARPRYMLINGLLDGLSAALAADGDLDSVKFAFRRAFEPALYRLNEYLDRMREDDV